MAAHPLAPVRGSDRLVVATSQTCATKPRRPPPCRSRPRASAAPLSVVRPFALASNESSDTFVLPFASQINHALSTPAHNRPFEAEVIFCVQGAISPILANVYLHYVFDLWVHRWRLTKASGDMIVIRYADDTIVGFQHEHEARTFLDEIKERMRQFELALHPDKTRLIRFGRHAAKQREKRGEGKPETFDFLGFTHFCTRSRKWGSFVIGRKTIKKRMRAKLLVIKIELRKKMHDPIAKTGVWMKQMLQGHLNYFAVSGNHPSLWWFLNKVKRLWLRTLRRRSQKANLSWERFINLVDRFFS